MQSNNDQPVTAQQLQQYYSRITTDIQSAGGYNVGLNFVHHDSRAIALELRNGTGYNMNIFISQKPDGRWRLLNWNVNNGNRVFNHFENLLQSFHDQIRSYYWRNVNAQAHVNNSHTNYNGYSHNRGNHYNGPN